MSTKLSKPNMVTPHYLFYYYSSKYFRHRTKCRKKKRKFGKFFFFVACKKVPQYPRVLTTLAFRVPYISEFYFGLTS